MQPDGERAEQTKAYQPRPRVLTVAAELNGLHIKLLVDTGAVISVIDEQFLLDIDGGRLPDLFKSGLANVTTVRGEAMPILGTVKLQLQIAGGTYRFDFHVVKTLPMKQFLVWISHPQMKL